MKNCIKPIRRRKFLKTGVTSGAILASLSLQKIFSFASPSSDICVESSSPLSNESSEKLLEIARKYGGEFADKKAEYKLRRIGHGSL